MKNKIEAFGRLLNIMDELREKCPWDQKQTINSLRYLTIEETYELSDAILNNNTDEIKNELGDILMHIIFYSRIASENNDFDIAEVINSVCEKLIYRHPHIYSNIKVKDAKEVKRNWELLKIRDGKKSVLEGVPKSLPSIIKSYRIQEKVRGIGFDWDNINQVWSKVLEEIEELKTEVKKNNHDRIESEFGDVLFSLINYARFINVNPSDALERTNKRFIKRFQIMENLIDMQKLNISKMSQLEMDKYWKKAKKLYTQNKFE